MTDHIRGSTPRARCGGQTPLLNGAPSASRISTVAPSSLLERFADLRAIADGNDGEPVGEEIFLRHFLHGLRIDHRNLLGEIRVVVQRQSVREERRQALAVRSLVSNNAGSCSEIASFARVSSWAVTRVSLILLARASLRAPPAKSRR